MYFFAFLDWVLLILGGTSPNLKRAVDRRERKDLFMGLEKLISAIAVFVVLTASTGQLPKLIGAVRKAQIQLIQDTKASSWGMPYLLQSSR